WMGSRSSPSTSGFSCSATAIRLLRVWLLLGHGVVGVHGVPAELVAQGRVDLGRERVLPARREALVERAGDHRHRDPLGDRVLNRPAALTGVLDPRLEPGQVVALLLE